MRSGQFVTARLLAINVPEFLSPLPNVVFSCGPGWRGPGWSPGPNKTPTPVRQEAVTHVSLSIAGDVTGRSRQLQNFVMWPASSHYTSGLGASDLHS